MKKLLYVCEADSGGIMEYAICQSAALVQVGVEVHFLCKPSFPKERLAMGIRVEEFRVSRESRGKRRALKSARGPIGKIGQVVKMISDLWSEAKQVAELAKKLASNSDSADLTTEDTESTENEAEHGEQPEKIKLDKLKKNPVSGLDARHSTLDSRTGATRDNLGEAEVCVLFACYKEYFAPFWVWPLWRLAKKGFVIGTIAHDPVRDFVVGPVWWHRWSVRLGYSIVRDVFVHDDTPVDFGGMKPAGIRVHQIPHGPYEVAEPIIGRDAMRKKLGFDSRLTTEFTESTEDQFVQKQGGAQARQAGASESDSLASKLADSSFSESLTHSVSIPASIPFTSYPLPTTLALPDLVFLAFGQIRDGKNLDLFLRAMTRLPANVKLLVAGKGDSGSSKPLEFYQKLAEELGVGDRCRWDIRRIPDEEVGDLFAACDVVLVTYSAKFRSASGVLNAAVSTRKPVLASSGAGPLKSVVGKYDLGVFVEPDDLEEIVRGASKFVPNSATQQPAAHHQLPATAPQALSLDSGHSPLDSPTPAWDRYESENSWEENAQKVLKALWP